MKDLVVAVFWKKIVVQSKNVSNEIFQRLYYLNSILDALTCKRMDVPMLLPCGQYVDRSSLDNYNDIESKWCRQPNDPFTGLIFTGKF